MKKLIKQSIHKSYKPVSLNKKGIDELNNLLKKNNLNQINYYSKNFEFENLTELDSENTENITGIIATSEDLKVDLEFINDKFDSRVKLFINKNNLNSIGIESILSNFFKKNRRLFFFVPSFYFYLIHTFFLLVPLIFLLQKVSTNTNFNYLVSIILPFIYILIIPHTFDFLGGNKVFYLDKKSFISRNFEKLLVRLIPGLILLLIGFILGKLGD